jgi:hypothetical protein
MNNKIDVFAIRKEMLKQEEENIDFITNKIDYIKFNNTFSNLDDNIIDTLDDNIIDTLDDKTIDNKSKNMNKLLWDLNNIADDSSINQVNQDKTSFDYREIYCKRKLNQTDFNSILRKKKLLSLHP